MKAKHEFQIKILGPLEITEGLQNITNNLLYRSQIRVSHAEEKNNYTFKFQQQNLNNIGFTLFAEDTVYEPEYLTIKLTKDYGTFAGIRIKNRLSNKIWYFPPLAESLKSLSPLSNTSLQQNLLIPSFLTIKKVMK